MTVQLGHHYTDSQFSGEAHPSILLHLSMTRIDKSVSKRRRKVVLTHHHFRTSKVIVTCLQVSLDCIVEELLNYTTPWPAGRKTNLKKVSALMLPVPLVLCSLKEALSSETCIFAIIKSSVYCLFAWKTTHKRIWWTLCCFHSQTERSI